MTQCGTLVSVNGESRIAWGISERERAIMRRLGQEGGESNAKD
jgi:hypothetical protein